MQHVKVTFPIAPDADSDVLIATLADAGYDGFEETADELYAYIELPRYAPDELSEISNGLGISFKSEVIAAQNWNALWESNFQPVIVEGICTIRAHFHDITVTTPYDIIITPKMSFGTGHHATTQLMIMMMKDMTLSGKSVLDFGTGTGVLAIMAELLGAAKILAIDNDPWCIENAVENAERNNCKNIIVSIESIEDVGDKADVVLANINRHILLAYMDNLFEIVGSGGQLLMSGLLTDDEGVILESARNAGFSFVITMELGGWIAMLFDKK